MWEEVVVKGRIPRETVEMPALDFGIGTVVADRYHVLGEIGEGAMGSVLHAEDLDDGRQVAVKIIRPEFGLNREFRDQFMDEARALARVRDHNVVSLLEIGAHNGLPFFVMEYIDGPTLRTWVTQRGGALAVDEALGFVRNICAGVQAIHNAGVVHRDLKPSNVLIGPGFRVAVADLGLALLDPALVGSSGSVAGTLAYLAPEVMLAIPVTRALAPRADVYALAAMTFELLSGQLPHQGETAAELLAQRLHEVPPRVSGLRPEIPAAFDEVLIRALHPDPVYRTPSAVDLCECLRYVQTRR